MLNFSSYEKNYFLPITFYWGFFKTAIEFPFLKDIYFTFRLHKKEYIFVLTFLTFFFKCFFLDQKVYFQIHYNNLYLTFLAKKKQYIFLFFLQILRFMSHFMPFNLVVKKHNFLVGKKAEGTSFFGTKKFFFLISEIFNMIFIYKPYNFFLIQLYNILQTIFYSSKGYSLNVFTFSKMFLPAKYSNYFSKLSLIFY